MKKIIFTLVVSLFAFAAFAQDMPIQPNQLPANAQSFISSTFSGATIVAAQKDRDEFEAALNNGIKITFALNGEWDSIESYSVLPAGILPAAVEAAANAQGGNIVKIDKDFGYYEVKLQNNVELKIDLNGKILKREID